MLEKILEDLRIRVGSIFSVCITICLNKVIMTVNLQNHQCIYKAISKKENGGCKKCYYYSLFCYRDTIHDNFIKIRFKLSPFVRFFPKLFKIEVPHELDALTTDTSTAFQGFFLQSIVAVVHFVPM